MVGGLWDNYIKEIIQQNVWTKLEAGCGGVINKSEGLAKEHLLDLKL